MSSSFASRIFYEIVVALVTLSTFPLVVALVAPLASLARIISFIVREIRLNHQRQKIFKQQQRQQINRKLAGDNNIQNKNNNNNFDNESNISTSPTKLNEKVLHQISEKVQQHAAVAAAAASSSSPFSSSSPTANFLNSSGFFNFSANDANSDPNFLLLGTKTTPNEQNCVVVVNAASSLEGEGLVRYYAARGCTVVACDRNASLLSELFKNEDSNLVRPCALYGPETVPRVRDVVASLCGGNPTSSSSFSSSSSSSQTVLLKKNLSLFAIIFVEPSGEIVVRRSLEREFLINSSPSAKSKIASTISSSSPSSQVPNSSESLMKLCEYLSHTNGGQTSGELISNFSKTVTKSKRSAQQEKKLNEQQKTNSKNSDDDDDDDNDDKQNDKSKRSKMHRRTSSLDAAAVAAVVEKSSSKSAQQQHEEEKLPPSSFHHHAKSFTDSSSKTLSDQVLDNFVFIPVKTQTSLLRELTPIALSKKNQLDNDPTSGFILQPRVCIITRSNESEELSTALCLLHYSTAMSSSSSASLFFSHQQQQQNNNNNNNNNQSCIQTIAGISKMRRFLMESLIEVCHSLRNEHQAAIYEQNENEKRKQQQKKNIYSSSPSSMHEKRPESINQNFLRCCHIDLFSTSAQRSSQTIWLQGLADFCLTMNISSNMTGNEYSFLKKRWGVPKLPFSFLRFLDSGENEEQEQSAINDSESGSSPSYSRKYSSSVSPSRTSKALPPHSADFSTCSFQISFLGETINALKPKTSKYFCPELGILEDSASNEKNRSALLSKYFDSEVVGDVKESEIFKDSSKPQQKFVPLSFWTRVLSWSFREERILDVMLAGFHSSPKLENVVAKVFEYVCS
jgi:hypothetical protein